MSSDPASFEATANRAMTRSLVHRCIIGTPGHEPRPASPYSTSRPSPTRSGPQRSGPSTYSTTVLSWPCWANEYSWNATKIAINLRRLKTSFDVDASWQQRTARRNLRRQVRGDVIVDGDVTRDDVSSSEGGSATKMSSRRRATREQMRTAHIGFRKSGAPLQINSDNTTVSYTPCFRSVSLHLSSPTNRDCLVRVFGFNPRLHPLAQGSLSLPAYHPSGSVKWGATLLLRAMEAP